VSAPAHSGEYGRHATTAKATAGRWGPPCRGGPARQDNPCALRGPEAARTDHRRSSGERPRPKRGEADRIKEKCKYLGPSSARWVSVSPPPTRPGANHASAPTAAPTSAARTFPPASARGGRQSRGRRESTYIDDASRPAMTPNPMHKKMSAKFRSGDLRHDKSGAGPVRSGHHDGAAEAPSAATRHACRIS